MPRHVETAKSATWIRWFFGAVITAAMIGAVLRFGDIRNFARLLVRAHPIWLLVAVLLQLLTYVSVASGWAIVLRQAGAARPLVSLVRIAVTKLFADQAVPSAGMGGNLLLIDQLVRLRVPRGTAVAALLITIIGYYAAFATLAVTMLVLLWIHDKATPLLAGLVTTFLIVALAIPSLALWLRHRGSKPLSSRLGQLGVVRHLLEVVGQAPANLVGDRRLLLQVAGCNGLVFFADAATLWACLHSLGESAAPATAFIALIMAAIVVTLSPIPLGLGSFEASSTAMLVLLGIPVETAFTGTMLLRILSLWLPLVPGLIFMRSAFKRHTLQAESLIQNYL